MKSFLHISKAFARRGRAGLIIFFLITTFALSLTGGALSLAWGINSAYDERRSTLSGPDALFIVPDEQMTEQVRESLNAVEGVERVELENAVVETVSIDVDGETQEQRQIFHDAHAERTLGVLDIVEGDLPSGSSRVALSAYTAMHLEDTSTYKVTIAGRDLVLPIVGRVEEMRYGNYSSGIIGQYIDTQTFTELWNDPQASRAVVVSLKAHDAEQAYRDAGAVFAQQGVQVIGKNWVDNQKNQRLSISRVVVGIVLAFAGVSALVALLLAQFRLAQSVREERTHMGIMKAIGYTNRSIIVALLLPYIIVVAIAGVVSYAGAHGIARLLSSVVAEQSGFLWQANANILLSAAFTILFALITVAIGWLRVRKVHRVSAIRAIRDIPEAHSSLAQNASLMHSSLPLNLWHMRRAFMSSRGHNLVLGITLIFLTVLTSFTFILYHNVSVRPLGFINTLVEEHPSIVVNTADDIKAELENVEGVDKALYYDDKASLSFDGNSYTAFVADSFDGLANDLCYEGRNPVEPDEVALGSALADAYDVSLGGSVLLSYEGVSAEYRVVGFVQSVNNSGEIIEITRHGYEQLRPTYQPSAIYLYVSGDNSQTIQTVINHIEQNYGEQVSVMNYADSMNAAANIFVSLVSALALVLVLIAILLILFILSVFARAIMTERQRDIGIMKAIGNTSRQLAVHLAGGFTPSILLGVAVGVAISFGVMPKLYAFVFGAVGAYKVSFVYPMSVYLAVGFAMIVAAFALSLFSMRHTRTIPVTNLLRG